MSKYHPNKHTKLYIVTNLLVASLATLVLAGCLEQIQTTRIASGSLSNFLIHLQNGELDDAKAYFAPGLVTPSAQLDESVKQASENIRRYQIRNKKTREEDLGNGQVQETISGQVRPITPAGQPTPAADQGWQNTDILTARMVVRGPGWRILDFELKCCQK